MLKSFATMRRDTKIKRQEGKLQEVQNVQQREMAIILEDQKSSPLSDYEQVWSSSWEMVR